MKMLNKIFHGKVILTITFLLMFTGLILAQGPPPSDPPPPPGSAGGGDQNTQGGGAPIGSGTIILMGLAAAYGGKKVYSAYSDSKNDLED